MLNTEALPPTNPLEPSDAAAAMTLDDADAVDATARALDEALDAVVNDDAEGIFDADARANDVDADALANDGAGADDGDDASIGFSDEGKGRQR